MGGVEHLSVRVFYAAGPGPLIESFKHWRDGRENPNLTAKSYSGQLADFCQSIDAEVYMVSHPPDAAVYTDGKFTIEHAPKPSWGSSGTAYHLAQMAYGLRLAWEAFRFGSNYAVIHSSSTHYFTLWSFRALGIRVIPVLHNTIWPAGFPSAGLAKRVIRRLDGLFFRYGARASLGVSPECLRQVGVTSGLGFPAKRLIEIRGQFSRSYFAAIPAPPEHGRPFRVMFSGRMTENKGIFDLIEIVKAVEARCSGSVVWDVCGGGPGLDEFKRRAVGLENIVNVHGHVLPDKMREILTRNHAAIVPTKSTFEEGMALSAVEPVLCDRPVITCKVVPASEVLGGACLVAATDDVDSYAEAVIALATSPDVYRAMSVACGAVKSQFLDGEMGFEAGLRRAF